MESYPLPHLSTTAHLALFTPLSPASAASLRQRLVAASTAQGEAGDLERRAVDFAFLDASRVTSRLHVLTAVNQALLAQASPAGLKTKTAHSEVLWMLEPGTNITDSLRHFGLSPSTRSLLLVHLAPSPSSSSSSSSPADASPPPHSDAQAVLARLEKLVEGSGARLESLKWLGRLPDGGTDEKGLRKLYKLNADAAFSSLALGSPQHLDALDRLCTSAVALKAAM
ncbi:hypothetical protein JCM8097_003981 [Rhodosporidiobolus ruineniae]